MSIYQLLTDRFARTDGSTDDCPDYLTQMKYCGGTWVGIKNNLQYIKDMGFDAIWISPVWKNLPNAFHGYSISDLYKLNDHFGTDQDFKDMIAAAHNSQISVMIDVVPNHMGAVMFDYEQLNPFNKAEHYHDYCYIQNMDYQHNQWRIVNCRLLDLPDLKQEHPFVRQTLLDHVENFVRDYQIDGLRLDAVPHMPHWFITEYYEAAKKGTVAKGQTPSDIFIVGEAFDPRFDFVRSFQQNIPGLFNFPMFFNIIDVFKNGKSPKLISDQWKNLISNLGDGVDALGLFIDNHDNQRFLFNVKPDELWRLNNALAFIFNVRGIPCLYYGTEQGFATDGDPYNRQPLWTTKFSEANPFFGYIAALNKNRKDQNIVGAPFNEVLVDDTVYAFTRGNVFVITRNSGTAVESALFTMIDSQGKPIYPVGSKLVNWKDPKDVLTVGEGSVILTRIPDGMPLIYNLVQSEAEASEVPEMDTIVTEEANQYTLGL